MTRVQSANLVNCTDWLESNSSMIGQKGDKIILPKRYLQPNATYLIYLTVRCYTSPLSANTTQKVPTLVVFSRTPFKLSFSSRNHTQT